MEILRILVRAVIVAAPATLIPVGPADIGGAGLVILASLTVAVLWGAYDGRRDPSGRTWLRWAGVTGALVLAVVVKSVVGGDTASDVAVGALLIGGLVGAAAAAGVGLGGATRSAVHPQP